MKNWFRVLLELSKTVATADLGQNHKEFQGSGKRILSDPHTWAGLLHH